MPRRAPLPTLMAGIGAGLLALAPAGTAVAAPIDPIGFADTVTVDAVAEHLERLQTIAAANGGNRAVGTPGYEAGAAYIESVLTEAGYTPERQYFEVTQQTIDSHNLAIGGVDVDPEEIPLSYTPSTDPATGVTAGLVVPAAALGCDAAAWNGVDATGKIAVVSRGECSFAEKNLAAAAAGAVGIVIYNNTSGDLNGTLGEPDEDFIAGVGVQQAQGQAILDALAANPALQATLQIDQMTEQVQTFNIVAETSTGTPDNVVMLGAHLDSVPEGPGINDNGSGSAAILETAVQLAQSGDLNNKVRFAWWGAEEIGLLGSAHYVDDLVANDPAELDRIATYLNFDMVGSPNYVISVYDADQSTFQAPVDVPSGSVQTEDVFTDYFDSIGQPYVDTEFDGRSDYEAFILNGIPASGLFTGADGEKTAEEVALFGGEEGEQYDPNYHTDRDTLDRINEQGLGIMLKAIAFATASLANDTSAINGFGAAQPSEPVAPGATPAGQLAATGADATPFLASAGLLMIAGAAAVVLARRRVLADARLED